MPEVESVPPPVKCLPHSMRGIIAFFFALPNAIVFAIFVFMLICSGVRTHFDPVWKIILFPPD